MQVLFLVAVVAFAAVFFISPPVCKAQPPHPLTNCSIDSDCDKYCPGSKGVCSPPEDHCHCHDVEKNCTEDINCEAHCSPKAGCCHNHDHCHCEEVCDDKHPITTTTSPSGCRTDADCSAQCGPQGGCCHNQDHCHCGETCGPH